MYWEIIDKVQNKIQSIKGIDKAFFLDEKDRLHIAELENKDEKTSSRFLGIKNNVGIKEVFRSDVVMSFLTNKEYDWPKNNLQLIQGKKLVGHDISDPVEIKKYMERKDCLVIGNIVIYNDGFSKNNSPPEELFMVINSKPFPEIEKIPFVSGARLASPSRLTHEFIKTKIGIDIKSCSGTFLVGFNIDKNLAGKQMPNKIPGLCPRI